jgi:hypothetical protein
VHAPDRVETRHAKPARGLVEAWRDAREMRLHGRQRDGEEADDVREEKPERRTGQKQVGFAAERLSDIDPVAVGPRVDHDHGGGDHGTR